jgi:FG-GAP repeat
VSRRTPILVTVCAAVIAVAAPSAATPAKPAKAAPLPSAGHRYGLTPTGLIAGGTYGAAGAISGDTVVTEIPQAVNGGVFYVFVRPKAGWRAGLKPVAQLTAPSESTIDPENPATVAISGDTIVISEPGQTVNGDGDQGAVYVYVRPKTGWVTTASPTATLTNADGQPNDDFGHASIDGNTIVVGAPGPNGNTTVAGTAFVYVGPPGGWTNSGDPTARLSSSDSAMGDAFGASTAISGSTIVVASPQAFVFAHTDAGAGFLYVKPSTGWKSATPTRRLFVGQGTTDQELTEADAVAVQGSTVVLGAMDSVVNGVRTGAAYVFARPSKGWGSSALVTPAVLTPSDGAANDLFGEHVGISGRLIVTESFNHTVDGVADAGAGYLFAEPTSGWKTSSKATEFGAAKPTIDDHFVAYGIDRAAIVAGATGFETGTGAAYVFASPPPVLSKVAESATSFTIGSAPARANPKHHPAGGIVFRFHLNQPSAVTLRFTPGSLTVHGRKGVNRIWFDGRLAKHKTIHRGHQKVRFQANDSNGTSTTTTLRLTVH